MTDWHLKNEPNVELHVPVEQYGFVAFRMLTDDAGQIREAYDKISEAFKPKPTNSLPTKDFNDFLDRQLLGEGNHLDEYEKMSPNQKMVVQEIKKSIKRLKAKNE